MLKYQKNGFHLKEKGIKVHKTSVKRDLNFFEEGGSNRNARLIIHKPVPRSGSNYNYQSKQ